MSEMSPEPASPGSEIDWSVLAVPGSQAIYLPCRDESCPQPSPPEHMHLDHVSGLQPVIGEGVTQNG